jgi:hypothetical protein
VNALLGRAMPPQYDLQLKFRQAAAEWPRVVGSRLGSLSAPLSLTDGELLVVADTPLSASRLSMMGGSIAHALMERWRIEVKKVKVVVGRLPLKDAAEPKKLPQPTAAPRVSVKEGDVKKLEQTYLEKSPDLPEDAALALAHFRAFFMKRFGR